MRRGYTRWMMYLMIGSLLAGVFAGCASRASGGNDPLVYPGADKVEIPENAQADWLELLKRANSWMPPIGVPVGTPLIFYGTPDHETLVLDYYAGSLPEDGWTMVHQWENQKMYLTQWSKGSDQLFLAVHHDYIEAWIELQNRTYGLDMPTEGTGIWVMRWKE